MRILSFILVFIAGNYTSCLAQDFLKNRPEYSLPISNEKLVIAHCMTNIITYKNHPLEDSCNSDYYTPTGNVTSTLGGLTQVRVMSDSLMQNKSLEEAVEFEIRAALRSGIDGFQFYYVLGAQNWDTIITAYFDVIKKKKLPFKLTFCISHPDGRTEKSKTADFSARIKRIMQTVGKDNPAWLRTPDGRLIVYLWNGEGMADVQQKKDGLPKSYYMAKAYQQLADNIGERVAYVVSINKEITEKELHEILDYFPAVWLWTLPYHDNYVGHMVAEICAQRGRTFTASVFNDFYTSKLLKKGTWDMYHRAKDAVKAGISNVDRKYVTTGLTYNFTQLLALGIKHNSNIINVITWNDYPEGHHLAPEINHNEGFSLLLNHYKGIWKTQASPYAEKDLAIVFFKKYPHQITPSPFNIPVVSFQAEYISKTLEDSIEVVTILKAPASLTLNGKQLWVKAGYQLNRFPMKEGPVTVSVNRNEQTIIHFSTPEGITYHPYRSDRITYAFSNEFNNFYRDLFPGFKPIYSHEYNPAFTVPKNN